MTTLYNQIRYNQVRQQSAHNVYKQKEGPYDVVLYWQVRSFEMDIHNDKGPRANLDGDWYIYHLAAFSSETNVDKLSELMDVMRGIRTACEGHEVITLWIDLKDQFDAPTHTPDKLDNLLRSGFGDTLYTPADLMSSQRRARSLKAAAQQGWPTLLDLRGKIIVGLTDATWLSGGSPLDDYIADGAATRAAFIAPAISSEGEIGSPDVVFYNMKANDSSVAEEVFRQGLVSRAYGNNDETSFSAAKNHKVHHIGTDNINTDEFPWARIYHQQTGFPFEGIDIDIAPNTTEARSIVGLQGRSGQVPHDGHHDSFHFWYRRYSNGDSLPRRSELAISVPSSFSTEHAKGGLMLRAGLDDDDAYFAITRNADQKAIAVQYRERKGAKAKRHMLADDQDGVDKDVISLAILEVSNGGKTLTGYTSIDGSRRIQLKSVTFSEPLLHLGVFGCSADKSHTQRWLFYPYGTRTNWKEIVGIGSGTSDGTVFGGIQPG